MLWKSNWQLFWSPFCCLFMQSNSKICTIYFFISWQYNWITNPDINQHNISCWFRQMKFTFDTGAQMINYLFFVFLLFSPFIYFVCLLEFLHNAHYLHGIYLQTKRVRIQNHIRFFKSSNPDKRKNWFLNVILTIFFHKILKI